MARLLKNVGHVGTNICPMAVNAQPLGRPRNKGKVSYDVFLIMYATNSQWSWFLTAYLTLNDCRPRLYMSMSPSPSGT